MDNEKIENEVVIKYGMEMIKTIIIGIIATIIVGLIIGIPVQTVFFVMLLYPLRQYAGGYHMNSKQACAVLSLSILAVCALLIRFVHIQWYIQAFVAIIGAVIVWIAAPVENRNNQLDEYSKKRFRKITRIILIAELILALLFSLLNQSIYSQIVVLAIAVCSMLVIAEVLMERLRRKIK